MPLVKWVESSESNHQQESNLAGLLDYGTDPNHEKEHRSKKASVEQVSQLQKADKKMAQITFQYKVRLLYY